MAIVQRVNWIDWGKVFAIYLVVLGHLVSNDGTEGRIHDFIYLFHMPFFFFISGLLFKIKENNIRDLFSRIWRSLIIPYIFLNLLSDIFLIPSWILGRERPLENLMYFLTADGHGEPGPTWFLVCLAWLWIAFYYLSRLSYRWQCLILVGCGVVASLFPYTLYWRIDSAVMVLPFFVAGYYSKSLLTWHTDKYKMILITIGLILISFYISYINGYSSVYIRSFGNLPILYYPGAFIGVIMLIMISKMFDKWGINIISVLSSGTIVIMGLHGVVILYLKLVMKRLGILAFDNYSIGGKVFIGLLSMAVLYFVILLLQRYCSQWIGNRK